MEYFSKYGEIIGTVVMREKTFPKKSRGFGFVIFRNQNNMDKAIQDSYKCPHSIHAKSFECKKAVSKDEIKNHNETVSTKSNNNIMSNNNINNNNEVILSNPVNNQVYGIPQTSMPVYGYVDPTSIGMYPINQQYYQHPQMINQYYPYGTQLSYTLPYGFVQYQPTVYPIHNTSYYQTQSPQIGYMNYQSNYQEKVPKMSIGTISTATNEYSTLNNSNTTMFGKRKENFINNTDNLDKKNINCKKFFIIVFSSQNNNIYIVNPSLQDPRLISSSLFHSSNNINHQHPSLGLSSERKQKDKKEKKISSKMSSFHPFHTNEKISSNDISVIEHNQVSNTTCSTFKFQSTTVKSNIDNMNLISQDATTQNLLNIYSKSSKNIDVRKENTYSLSKFMQKGIVQVTEKKNEQESLFKKSDSSKSPTSSNDDDFLNFEDEEEECLEIKNINGNIYDNRNDKKHRKGSEKSLNEGLINEILNMKLEN